MFVRLGQNVYFITHTALETGPSSLVNISFTLGANVANPVLPAIFLKQEKRDVCWAAVDGTEPYCLRMLLELSGASVSVRLNPSISTEACV